MFNEVDSLSVPVHCILRQEMTETCPNPNRFKCWCRILPPPSYRKLCDTIILSNWVMIHGNGQLIPYVFVIYVQLKPYIGRLYTANMRAVSRENWIFEGLPDFKLVTLRVLSSLAGY